MRGRLENCGAMVSWELAGMFERQICKSWIATSLTGELTGESMGVFDGMETMGNDGKKGEDGIELRTGGSIGLIKNATR